MRFFWLYALLFAITLSPFFLSPYPSLYSYIRGRGCFDFLFLGYYLVITKAERFLFFLIVPGAGGLSGMIRSMVC